jgi:hypothetical protein
MKCVFMEFVNPNHAIQLVLTVKIAERTKLLYLIKILPYIFSNA